MTQKRFIYCFEGIEDKWETVEEHKYTPCTKDGFQDLCYMLNKLHEENEQLKQFQNKVAEIIMDKMEDNQLNDYKMEVLKEIWNELNLNEVWYE